jgi:biopolymer transport protein ExbD
MARQQRETEDDNGDLDLAPFMNMVVILIPMLLLSVVFVKIGVINITAPKLSVGPPSEEQPEEDEEEPLNLTIAINAEGFRIAAKAATLPEMEGCPRPGPTICLEDQDVDVADKFDQARTAFENEQEENGQKLIQEGMAAYNYRELYNKLAEIKKEYPDETVVNLSADSDIPYAVLVRVMDVARYKLSKDSFSQTSEFAEAEYDQKGDQYAELFSDPVLSVVQ